LISEIEKGFSDKAVYIPRIVGMDILLALTDHGKNLRTIVVPPSIHPQISERVKSYLEKERISLEKGHRPVGRPPKYTEEDIKEIIRLKKENVPITKICKELNIPRRTIYYLLEEK
jgi:hypothetical protein